MDTSKLRSFAETPTFTRRWAKLGLDDADLAALQQDLNEEPQSGATVSDTGGFRKYRFAPPSWEMGGSGATRVLHLPLFGGRLIVLGVVYGKNEVSTINAAGKKVLKGIAKEYEAVMKQHFPEE